MSIQLSPDHQWALEQVLAPKVLPSGAVELYVYPVVIQSRSGELQVCSGGPAWDPMPEMLQHLRNRAR